MKTSFQIVDSLEGLKPGRIYSTLNYHLFKSLEGNRGRVDGKIQSKVNSFKKLIENGSFFTNVHNVIVNLSGVMIDGHHREEALAQSGRYVNFYVTAERRFNEGTLSQISNAVSELNSVNSRWSSLEPFKSAFINEEPCASSLDKIREEFCSKLGVKRTSLTPSRILSLVRCFSDGFTQKTFKREDYCDTAKVKIIESDEFRSILNSVCEIMMFSRVNGKSREWDIILEIAKKIVVNDERDVIKYTLEFSYWMKRVQMSRTMRAANFRSGSDIKEWLLTI